jgi:hypothetical protein
MNPRIGAVFLILFILPFLAVGIALGVLMVEAFLEGDIGKGFLLLAFSGAFGSVGVGLLVALLRGRGGQRDFEHRKTLFPGEPWRWKKEWESNEIQSSAKSGLLLTWVFTFLWNSIAFPLIFLLRDEIIEKGNLGALAGLMFPLVGTGVLVYALKLSWSYLSYGSPVFVMNEVPGVIGGELSGRIEVRSPLQPTGGFTVRLSCIKRTESGSGDSRSTHDDVCWQEEQTGILPGVSISGSGSSIPLRFLVPFDCEQSSVEAGGVFWRLEVVGAVPGVDFTGTFVVPLFKTVKSLPSQTEEELRSTALKSWHGFIPPTEAGIRVQRTTTGGTEFVIAAGRNAGIAAIFGVVTIVWTGILALVLYAGAPLLFSIVFGIFDLIFLFGVVQFMFTETRIVVETGHVAIRRYVFGLMFGKRIPCADIEHVHLEIGAQAGTSTFQSIALIRKGGAAVNAGGLIRIKRHAEWLADTLEKAIAAEKPRP